MSNLSSFFILVFLCACLPLSAAVLFDNGRSDYVIVLGRNARAVEKTAAKELREHVKQMGGVDLPVVESLPAGRKAIRITSVYYMQFTLCWRNMAESAGGRRP